MTTSSSIWFQGPVAEAVTQVNAKGCVFVVFARDESPESDAMSAILEDDSIVQRLREHAVAITLSKDTDNANLFNQLYPIHRYPSLFFLKAGVIVDVITGSDTSSAEITNKFDKAVAHSVTQPPAPQPVARPAAPTSTPPAPEPTGVSSPTVTESASTAAQTPLSAAEKKEALKKKLELARKKRAEEEEKNKREKEIQRRRTGQEIQAAQESHEERQRRKYAEEVKKERKAEEEHRRQLREQIESDKRERAAQRQREIEERQKSNSTPLSNATSTASSSKSTTTVCNLNVRQLDGSQIRKQFNAVDTLDVVMKWIDQERTDGDAPYMLLAQFPTRQFSVGDESRTLRELELVPSSTLIMKPSRKVTTAYAPTAPGIWGYAYSAMDMAYGVAGASWNFVNNVLTTLLPASGGITGGTTLGAQNEFGTEEEQASSDSRAAAAARRIRSNVNTLDSLRTDDKDPNQTYNGNSINQE
ncbi:hypothetical protein BGW37DRAFT_520210 [Umbelopsis sp. PMI_123]|nr:hypothetical protein BGW37DRAFT_520210 [Umbelopsis sp. PMI_123]